MTSLSHFFSLQIRFNALERHCLSLEHQLNLIDSILKSDHLQSMKRAEKRQVNAYSSHLKAIQEQIMSAIGQLPPVEHQRDELFARRAESEVKLRDVFVKLASAKELFAKSTQKCDEISSSYDQMSESVKKLKPQSIQAPRSLEPDQTFTFKLNFLTLINLDGEIRSEPILTAINGYVLALGVEISTDAKSNERFVGVNVYFLPGEFDAILHWPFPFALTISLLHYQGKSPDLVYSIPRPMVESVYGDPKLRNTKPYRIGKLCSMDILRKQPNDYVENDSIFIRAHVNFQPNLSAA